MLLQKALTIVQCNLKENIFFQELTFLEMLEKDSWALEDNYSKYTGEVVYQYIFLF